MESSSTWKLTKRASNATASSCQTLRASNLSASEPNLMMSMNTIFSAADASDRRGSTVSDYYEIDDELSEAYAELSEDEDAELSEEEVMMYKEPLRVCKRNSMGEYESESEDDSSSRKSLQLDEIDCESDAKTAVTEEPRVNSTAKILQLQRKFFQQGVHRPEGSLFVGENRLSAGKARSSGVTRVISTVSFNSKGKKCDKERLSRAKMEYQTADISNEKIQCESDDDVSEMASYHRRLSIETKEEDVALFAGFIDSALNRAGDDSSSSVPSTGSPDLKEDKLIIATSFPGFSDSVPARFDDADKRWLGTASISSYNARPDLKDAPSISTSVTRTESSSELDNSYQRRMLSNSFRKDLEGIRQMMIEVGDAAEIKAAAARTSKTKDASSYRMTSKRTSSTSQSKSSYESSRGRDIIKKSKVPQKRCHSPSNIEFNKSMMSLQESVAVEVPMIDKWIDSIFISLYPSSETLEFSSVSIEADTDKAFVFDPNVTKQRMYNLLKNLRHDINDFGPSLPEGKRGYAGNHNDIGQRNGFGVYRSSSGNEYKGEWLNGRKHGFGVARYTETGIYYGQWKDNHRDGHGVMQIANGDVYEGDWSRHKKNGIGVYYYSDGEVDLSFYVNDRRIGCGVRWKNDRSKVYSLNGSTLGMSISFQQAETILKRHRIEIAHSD